MQQIKKIKGVVTEVVDLSSTAREVTISLVEDMPFSAGSFVNLFIERDGVKERRAFSISSSEASPRSIAVSIRLNPKGAVSPLFWKDTIIGTQVELMGPLGLNTADKMQSKKIFLFGYGIGAGVVKALLTHFIGSGVEREIVVMTGSRSVQEVIFKDYFEAVAHTHAQVKVAFAVSSDEEVPLYKKGYIQANLDGLDFNDSDVYVCGQEVACNSLVEAVKQTGAQNTHFFVEGFH